MVRREPGVVDRSRRVPRRASRSCSGGTRRTTRSSTEVATRSTIRPPPEGGEPLPPLVGATRWSTEWPARSFSASTGKRDRTRRCAPRSRSPAAFKRPLVIVFGYAPAAMGGQVADISDAVQQIGTKITRRGMKIVHEIDPSVEVKAELVNDRPAEAILRAAEEHDALMIVVGAAGRGPIAARCSARSRTRSCTARPARCWSCRRRERNRPAALLAPFVRLTVPDDPG